MCYPQLFQLFETKQKTQNKRSLNLIFNRLYVVYMRLL